MDYLYFLHGLFLILLACAVIGVRRDIAFSLGFLSVFAFFQGLDILLRLPLLCCLPMSPGVIFFHVLLQVLAAIGILCLACREAPRGLCKIFFGALLVLVLGDLFLLRGSLVDSLETAAIHLVAVAGMLAALFMWMRARQVAYPRLFRFFSLLFATYVCLVGYSYVSGLLPGKLVEEIALNRQVLQLVFTGILACIILCLVIMDVPVGEWNRKNLLPLLWKKVGMATCAVILVLGAGYWAASFVGRLSADHFKTQLIDRVKIIKAMLDDDDLEALKAGVTHEHYREVYETMTRTISSQNDIMYGYVVALRDDQIVFLLDAEATLLPDDANITVTSPGSVYEDDSPGFNAILRDHRNMPIAEGPLSDSWGSWISGIVPLMDEDGQIFAALGVDIDTRNYNLNVDQTRLPVIGIIGAICLAIVIWHIQRAKEMRTAARLAMSEKHYHDIFSGAPIGIFESSPDGTIIDTNQTSLEILGYTDDVEAKLLSRQIGLAEGVYDDPAQRDEIVRLVMENDAWHQRRLRLRRRDGSQVTTSLTIRGVHDINGRLARLQGFIEDITARVEAEQELEEQTLFLQQLINAIPTPVYFKSLDGRYQNGNKAFADLIGKPAEEYRGKTVFDIATAEEAELYHAKDLELLRQGGLQAYEGLWRSPNGTVRNLMFHKALTMHVDGRHAGIVGVIFDITDIKQTEEKLRQSEAKLQSILDALPDLLLVADLQGNIQEIRAPSDVFLSMPADQMLGRKVQDVLPASRARQLMDRARMAVESKMTQTYEYVREVSGEKHFFEGRVAPLGKNRVVLVSRDVTDRSRAEEKLLQTKLELEAANLQLNTLVTQARAAAEEAERASKAKSEFLANMSHELRTPLNAIMGFAEMISSEMLGPIGNAHYKEYVGYIHTSGAHLLDIINDVLDLSRIEAGKMQVYHEPVEIPGIFNLVGDLMRAHLGEREQTLEVDLAPDLPPILGDERLIKQILINLISNAHKFSPEKARITMAAQRLGDHEVELSVADTGIGMEKDSIEQALQPFVQLENYMSKTQQGTGLGLPLVKAFTELQGGRFMIESEPGKGTTVRVILRVFEPGMPVSTFQVPQDA